MEVKDKVIVVTGAGSGIGRQLALQLLAKGARVAAVDLDEAALEETVKLTGAENGNISAHVANIADRDRVEALPAEVTDAHGAVDGVINNAGIIQPFVVLNELSYDVIDRVIDVNLYGPIYMTKAFLPLLLERPEGYVANVSSMGGFLPVPGQSLYGASKAAVKLQTEALYAELMETNVNVSVIFPGAIATDIANNSGVAVAGAEESNGRQMTSAEDAARTIIEGIERDQYRILIGSDAKMMDKLYRLMPKRAVSIIYNQMKDLLSRNN